MRARLRWSVGLRMRDLFSGIIAWVIVHLLELSAGISLVPVHWNSSNQIFKPSTNSNTIEVRLHDQIDFVCPYYSQEFENSTSVEYYTVFQVTKEMYDACNISLGSTAAMIVNCSNPFQQKRFTILFEIFQAIPNAPEFVPGSSYYYITTSTGQRNGLANKYLGACDKLNMKLTVYVCCDTDAVEPTTHAFQFSQTTAKRRRSRRPPQTTRPFVVTDPFVRTKEILNSNDNAIDESYNSPNINIPKHDTSVSQRYSNRTNNDVNSDHQKLKNCSLGLHKMCRDFFVLVSCLTLLLLLGRTR